MKRIFLIINIIILFSIILFAVDKTYLDDIIANGSLISGRISALGNAGVAIVNDASAIIYNPSLMLELPVHTINLEKATLSYKTDLNNIMYIKPGEKNWFGIAYISLKPDNTYFIQRDNAGNSTGNFNITEDIYLLSYARKIKFLKKPINFGTTIKYFNKTIGNYSNSCFDIAFAFYKNINKNIGYAFMFDNLISSKLGDDNLPRRINAGCYFTFFEYFLLTTQTGFVLSPSAFKYNVGLEYNFKNFLYLRTGYENSRISCGTGLRFSDFEFSIVYKMLAEKIQNETLTLFSFNWKLGLNKRNRLIKYDYYFEKARESLTQENYKAAINLMEQAISVIKPKSDKEQYKSITLLLQNTKSIYENQIKELERKRETNKEYFLKGKELFEKEEYEPAKYEFMRIEKDSEFYEEAQKYLVQTEEKIRQQKLETDVEIRVSRLLEEYNGAKDLSLKISIGEMIIQLKYDQKIKDEIDKLKKALAAQKIYIDKDKTSVELQKLLAETNKQRAEESLKKIRKYYQQGYYELCRDEILEVQKLINDNTWEEKLLNEVNIKITKKKEEEAFNSTVKTLFDEGFKDFVTGKYSSALTKISKVISMKKDYPGAQNLYERINAELEKSGQKVKIEKTMTEAEIQLQKAKIERLFQEGLSMYIAGNIPAAREKWQQILELDPDNEKVKQYLKVIK